MCVHTCVLTGRHRSDKTSRMGWSPGVRAQGGEAVHRHAEASSGPGQALEMLDSMQLASCSQDVEPARGVRLQQPAEHRIQATRVRRAVGCT
jgi:hypothetical protein